MGRTCGLLFRIIFTFSWSTTLPTGAIRVKKTYLGTIRKEQISPTTLPFASFAIGATDYAHMQRFPEHVEPEVPRIKEISRGTQRQPPTIKLLVGQAITMAQGTAELLGAPLLFWVWPLLEWKANHNKESASMADAYGGSSAPRNHLPALMVPQGHAGTEIATTGRGFANHANQSEHMALLMAIGGGIGASAGGRHANPELLRRIDSQHKGILLMIVAVYFVALAFSASYTYWQAVNNSPVTYFCLPRRIDGTMSGHSTLDFLETFNQPPETSLQISGFERVPRRTMGSIRWQGEYFRTVFSLSFDLSPWMARGGEADTTRGDEASRTEGIHADDLIKLDHFLSHDDNDLAYVEISKETSWQGWEELATNIKHTIRQQGFTGTVSVRPSTIETLRVRKNTPWANFVHARTTFLLCFLSTFGLWVYLPYTWLRCKQVTIRSQHRVNVSISQYWPLISSKLNMQDLQGS